MSFSFDRRVNIRGLFPKGKQMSANDRRQAAEALVEAEAKAGYERKDGALRKLVEHSAVADRIPEAFREGTLHRSHDFNVHGFGEAWARGEEDPHQTEGAIERIARDLDSLVDRIHSEEGDGADETGFADEGVQSLVRDLRKEAHLGSRFPNSLVEGWLAYALNHDPDAAEVIRNKEQNPAAYENLIKHAGFALNRDAISLENATRPSMKLPKGVDVADLAEMSDREFSKVVQQHRRAQEAAKKARKK
jgi:hypothetical protein